MKNRVTIEQLHRRMALGAWILPLISLLTISVAGDQSLFAFQESVRARERAMGMDIFALSTLALGIMLSVYCVSYGWAKIPRRYGSHAIAGLLLCVVVIGLGLLAALLRHPVPGPIQ